MIRFLANRTQPLTFEEEEIAGDFVDLSGDELIAGKREALLSLAKGEIQAVVQLNVWDDESMEPSQIPLSPHWRRFLEDCAKELKFSQGWWGVRFEEFPKVLVPKELWSATYMDWHNQRLIYRDDGLFVELGHISVAPASLRAIVPIGSLAAEFGVRKPGRPPVYDWDAIWTELVVRADLDNLPATQAECVSMMLDWCQERWGDKIPSATQMKDKLRLVYRHSRKAGK